MLSFHVCSGGCRRLELPILKVETCPRRLVVAHGTQAGAVWPKPGVPANSLGGSSEAYLWDLRSLNILISNTTCEVSLLQEWYSIPQSPTPIVRAPAVSKVRSPVSHDPNQSLGHFQVGSYRKKEPYRGSLYHIEALWKPYIP